ncbi:sigma-54 interaction domain-containing protein [Flavonifractor sp. An112]|uniref:sigma-54 interaction domain-containing protein n=1 Tax=Flavonifractor sp. An112 TaxID=1965544 RepID=UPI00174E3F40|nr:sigma 54-interacting transcriptional regulator [Flavonifractor sp. An112]HIZ93819.1 sigma 54-interacting transcriptional regulator [Candidatus Flavonifractor avicola]
MQDREVAEQIADVIRLCEDTDGLLIANRDGIVEFQRIFLDNYWRSGETVGLHIFELYPELDEESSTIIQALRTGKPSYNVLQDINNRRGERVLLESTTIPIVVDGQVACVIDSSKFHSIDQRVIRGEGGISTLDRIITQDPAMLALKKRIRDVAPLDSSVLIYGETGTGKELVAESLHSEGRRSGRPFVSQNCAAIPANLLESLFFGTEKGCYTGALTRKGLLEEADGGTLFLDEINSMEIGLQAKLLKVLEEKKVRRLGGSRDIPFDVRIVAAVNEEPAKLIREHRLREDLYYRLGVVRITLPPLRKRVGDIPLLIRYFIDQYNRKMKRSIRGISDQALRRLERYSWPGNVRELQNVIEGAFASARSELLVLDHMEDALEYQEVSLAEESREGDIDPGFSLTKALEQYERELLHKAMEQSSSISQAARLLGLSRQNLKYKLQKYNL